MRRLLFLLLAAAVALSGCVNETGEPDESDADRDGLPAIEETTPRNITIQDVNGSESARAVSSNPKSADSDGDGLDDLQEYHAATDPSSADTDGDGLLDGRNVTLDA